MQDPTAEIHSGEPSSVRSRCEANTGYCGCLISSTVCCQMVPACGEVGQELAASKLLYYIHRSQTPVLFFTFLAVHPEIIHPD